MENLKQKVDDLLNNIFYFDRPWDMEADLTHVSMPEINWGYQRGDPEWTYMLNRMEYLVDLGVYYHLSGLDKYRLKAESLIKDWILQNNKLNQSYHRTLDTGIRLLSWSYILINSNIDEPAITNSIVTQVRYLQKNYRTKDDLSNWGLLQSIGVLSCAIYLDEPTIKWWSDKLWLQLELQITSDGVHWENSILYHNQILLGLCRLQMSNDHINVQSYIDILAMATYKSCKPNYHQLQQNDSDDTNICGLLALAHFITKNPLYNFKAIDIRLLVLCMDDNVVQLKLSNIAHLFSDSGLSIKRCNEVFLAVHNHPYGSSHSHLMWGHIDFYNKGDILIDPGRYTYVDNDIRKKLKSIQSHNCAFNQNQYSEKILNSWDSVINAYAITTEKYNVDEIDVTIIYYNVEGKINTRYVILIGKQLIVFDQISQKKDEVVEANLIFAPNIILDGLRLTNKNYKIIHNYQRYTCVEQPYAKKYNLQSLTKKLKFESDDCQLINLLSLLENSYNLDVIYKDNNALAYRLLTNDVSYLIYICPREINVGLKIKKIECYSLYGKLIIINEKTNKKYKVKI